MYYRSLIIASAAFLLLVPKLLFGNASPRNSVSFPQGAKQSFAKVRSQTEFGNEGDAEVPAKLANRAWAFLDMIEKQHIESPSRRPLILAGALALLNEAHAEFSAVALERRTATIDSQEQLKTLLVAIWPAHSDGERAAKLANAFIDGMLDRVPGGAQWHRPADLKINETIANNRYVGTGIQISVNEKEHVPQIPIPFRGGPARKAGVKPGDLILSVDGKDTHDVPLAKVVDWLRGPEGTSVSMIVRQPGASERRTMNMVRREVPFETVQGFRRASEDTWDYRIDPELPVGFVCIKSIKSSTLHELREVERRLKATDVRALIIDLRFSEDGGRLQHAALVADGLLEKGLLWRVRDKQGGTQETRADPDCLFRDWPIALLVNGETRSPVHNALAAALQDNERAIVIGEATHYEGFVMSQLPLPNDEGAIVLRTGRLERSSGCGWPVLPDAQVAIPAAQQNAIHTWLHQKDLPELPPGVKDEPPADHQLAKAMSMLRAKLEAKKQ